MWCQEDSDLWMKVVIIFLLPYENMLKDLSSYFERLLIRLWNNVYNEKLEKCLFGSCNDEI